MNNSENEGAVPHLVPLSEETVRALLNEGAERSGLDFKRRIDLRSTEDLVKLAKHVGAMQMSGGYLVIGADDTGRLVQGMPADDAKFFDQATVHDKLAAYLAPGFSVRTATMEIDGVWLAVICVDPHPERIASFTRDGNYESSDGKQQCAFRAGEVFARHGSKSERATVEDIRNATALIRQEEESRARTHFTSLLADAQSALAATTALSTAPQQALSWALDPYVLHDVVIEQVRKDDLIPLKVLLSRAYAEGAPLFEAGDHAGLSDFLDRLVSVAAALVLVERPDLVERTVLVLGRIYDLQFDERGLDRSEVDGPALALEVITRVYSLGALALRLGDWASAVLLAGYTTRAHNSDYWGSWLCHGAARVGDAGLLQDPDSNAGKSLLVAAQERIIALDALHPDVAVESGDVITSLCQFDFVVALLAVGRNHSGRPHLAYFPHFARWFSLRTDPIVRELISNTELRRLAFPGDDALLAEALREIGQYAHRVSGMFNGWDWYEDRAVVGLLEANPSSGNP